MSLANHKTGFACLLIVVLALAAFASVTRNFRAVTTEEARRLDLKQFPKPLPDIKLIDSSGETLSLAQIGRSNPDGRQVTLITFIYTNCRTICRAGAIDQLHLEKLIQDNGWSSHIKLLTLSFDPARDTPAVLRRYADTMKADQDIWKFATVADRSDLASLLRAFEITVLPDGLGGYAHNAAIFLVDRQGRLAGAYAMDEPATALAESLHG
ncbi:hypothetical protein A7976_00650 [Methylobacillus sp. MM3]|jgi:protein SCO1/2|uniref:SCO family protein n=1 Tax=Methylobacillus sp. MM3 TaxID=1848039 RepID=UPI0007DF0604|nr:SCO family protein [Methylobacillus sp. MM3]OAJ70189.1 hypothetical protein A7976_00650 [Methylobacillus sp. MM3]